MAVEQRKDGHSSIGHDEGNWPEIALEIAEGMQRCAEEWFEMLIDTLGQAGQECADFKVVNTVLACEAAYCTTAYQLGIVFPLVEAHDYVPAGRGGDFGKRFMLTVFEGRSRWKRYEPYYEHYGLSSEDGDEMRIRWARFTHDIALYVSGVKSVPLFEELGNVNVLKQSMFLFLSCMLPLDFATAREVALAFGDEPFAQALLSSGNHPVDRETEDVGPEVEQLGEDELGAIVAYVGTLVELRQATRLAARTRNEPPETQGWFRSLFTESRSAAAERARRRAFAAASAADAYLRSVSSAWDAATEPKPDGPHAFVNPYAFVNPAYELEHIRKAYGRSVWDMLSTMYPDIGDGEDGEAD